MDADADAIAKLTDQGFEAHEVDLTAPGLADTLAGIVADRPVAAVLCLDVLEHVTEPADVLAALATVTGAHPGVELVVSIPNVAHRDVARRLLVGEWETTDSGLLDRTHVRFFTDRTLTELMTGAGWYESARLDFPLEESDQHVAGHPAFEPVTNLGLYLDRVRCGADEFGAVNQFVRRYHRGSPRVVERAPDAEAPFVSIVLRTQGRRPETLTDVLCCLAAQTCLDFEVVLVVHDSTRATRRAVAGGRVRGQHRATGAGGVVRRRHPRPAGERRPDRGGGRVPGLPGRRRSGDGRLGGEHPDERAGAPRHGRALVGRRAEAQARQGRRAGLARGGRPDDADVRDPLRPDAPHPAERDSRSTASPSRVRWWIWVSRSTRR